MEISQITGAGKDPVARVAEDQQLKNIGAIPVAQPINKDQDQKQSTPEQAESPSFEHLRQAPLDLLLRAINVRLTQTFGTTSVARNSPPVVEPALTPEIVSARVMVLLGAAFERFKVQHAAADSETLLTQFLHTADEALHQADDEARAVLKNLNVLDAAVVAVIDKTSTLIQTALTRFVG